MKTTKQNIFVATTFILLAGIVAFLVFTKHNEQRNIKNQQYSINLFCIESGEGYGYDIFQNNRIIIHQDIIPAITKNKPFENLQDAKKVGTLVIEKLRNKQKPYVSLEELKDLKIAIQ